MNCKSVNNLTVYSCSQVESKVNFCFAFIHKLIAVVFLWSPTSVQTASCYVVSICIFSLTHIHRECTFVK